MKIKILHDGVEYDVAYEIYVEDKVSGGHKNWNTRLGVNIMRDRYKTIPIEECKNLGIYDLALRHIKLKLLNEIK